MSSLEDLHCTKAETSVTAPFISMETILTGMATVRPVRMAVLIISVSYGEKNRYSWSGGRQTEMFSDISSALLMSTFKTISTGAPALSGAALSGRPELISLRRLSLDFINWHFHFKYSVHLASNWKSLKWGWKKRMEGKVIIFTLTIRGNTCGVMGPAGKSQHPASNFRLHKTHDIYCSSISADRSWCNRVLFWLRWSTLVMEEMLLSQQEIH